MQYEFAAPLWLWEQRSDVWTFVTVPSEPSAEIADIAAVLPRRGFRSVRVEVGIGPTVWRTSVFADAAGRFMLPIKKAVRDAEGLGPGDVAQISIEIVDL